MIIEIAKNEILIKSGKRVVYKLEREDTDIYVPLKNKFLIFRNGIELESRFHFGGRYELKGDILPLEDYYIVWIKGEKSGFQNILARTHEQADGIAHKEMVLNHWDSYYVTHSISSRDFILKSINKS